MKQSSKLIFFAAMCIALVAALIIYVSLSAKENPRAESPVRISEIMDSNKGSVPDENGEYYDWVELYNSSAEAVDISGYGLSDDITGGVKFVFPQGTKLEASGRIVVWCAGGEHEGGLYAPFSLSAGESVILYNSTGGTIDSVMTKSVEKGNTYALGQNGLWSEMRPSPGYPNTDEGVKAYEAYLMETGEDCGVYINEFMASNATTIADSYGNYSDWIELYNSTDAEVDISGFGISDNIAQPKKYVLPEGTVIAAKGYLLIFCSGNQGFSETGELHAPFKLKAYGEDVVLSSRNGSIIDSYSYGLQQTDSSMARTVDGAGEWQQNSHPTPGYPNSDDGYNQFMASAALPKGNIVISEIMGRNQSAYKAPDGNYYDIIELENTGSEPVSLLGYALSSNPKNPKSYVFGDVSIPAGGHIVVYAKGKGASAQTEGSELSCAFGINKEGDSVYLFDPNGIICDKLQAASFLPNVSYGRDSSGKLAYFKEPTVGAANGTGYEGITAVPVFSKTPGVYDEAIQIAINVPEGETVHYTLDCTTPNESSPVYTGPITAEKNTVIRAISVREGYITNYVTSGTFLFTTDNVNHAVPIVTLVTDPDNLWDSKTGIYAYGENFDPDLPYGDMLLTANYYKRDRTDANAWERAANFAMFDGETKRQVFNQNIGIRIAGSYGRGRAQKGFNIVARDEYGENRMNYKFFDNLDFTEYKALVLRAGAQDQNRSKIRDELAAGLLEGTDVDFLYQAYRPCVLYLNGEYWGVYFLREKRNRFFVAQHEGTDNTTDIIIAKGYKQTTYGDVTEWVEFYDEACKRDLSKAENYKFVTDNMDVDSFMDYMIAEIYNGNTDTYNIQCYKVADGKWKWIFYDFCWGFNNVDHQTLKARMGDTALDAASGRLFKALLNNAEWKDKFVRRFAELLNTAFAPDRVIALVDELYGYVQPEIAREREKFNGETFMGVKQNSQVLGTYEGFEREIARIKEFAQKRPDEIKKQLKSVLGLSDSYMAEVFG